MADVLPASFRGVPFAVRVTPTTVGRRLAEHEYPGKDGVYPEDLGRRGRRYRVQGFIVSNSLVYGGGDVSIQRQLLIAAAETNGSGLLVHPTLGVLTVVCESLTVSDDPGAATAADIEWSFVEFTQQTILGVAASTVSQVLSAAVVVDAAATTAFEAAAALGQTSASAAAQWTTQVAAGGQDATATANLAAQLPGPYGRYFAGANSGYLASGSGSVYSGDTTVSDLVAAAATARATLNQAISAVAADFAALTSSSASQAAADVQTLVADLLAACADPADAVRILSALAGFAPNGASVTAINDLFRRAVVNACCRAATTYQPASQNDAATLQAEVTGLVDNEITVAGDEGDDISYQAWKALRVTVVADLQARGAALAPLKTFNFRSSLPALYLAQRLYSDAMRADQLVSEGAPINPLFMPTTFAALAS